MKHILKLFGVCVLLSAAAFTSSVFAQTGPGGVGNATGSGGQPENKVWFRADAGTSTTADNTPISSWTSSSDNTVQASQNDPAKRPVLRTGSNGINNRPVVRFDGTDDFFNTTYTWPANQDEITMILVGRGTDFQSAIRMQSGGYIVYPWYSSFILSSDGGTSNGIASGLVTGTAVNIGIARYRRNTTNGMQTFRNGTLQAQRTSANNPLPSDNLLLGSFGGGSEFTNADIAEIIIYRAALNEAQRIIVENYLSSKYNVNIGTNDRYAHDGTHGNDVAGIGRAADASEHTNASSSRLNISSPSSLANDRFALFGHDNGALTIYNTDAPSGYRRLNRVWRYDETGGDVGTVTITFDVTGIGLPSGENFVVFVDADGNFSDATPYTGTLSGNTFTVTGVNIADDAYITLGRTYSGPSAPLALSYTPNTLTLVYGTSGSSVTPDVDDGGSSITNYLLVSLPSGISINSSGVISVAGTINPGTYTLSVTATNGIGSTTFSNVYTVTVQPFNVASIFYNSATVPLGASVSIAPNPAPPSGSGISFSAGSLPSGLSLNTSTGVISGTLATAGVYTVSVDINSSNPNTTGGPVTRTCQIAVLGATGPGGVGDDQTSPVWFRADAGTSTTADNTPISSWTSSSDNSVQASQNDPAKRPVLRTGSNGINNRPVVRFDGTDDFFNTTYTWPANQDQITMILVGRGTNFQSAIRMQSGGYIVYPWYSSFILSSDGGISGGIASGLVTGTAVNIGIARYRRNTTNGMQTFRNGTLQAQRTSANNPLPSDNLLLGSFGGGSEFTNADIAEIIIYRAALNEAQRIIVENYLSSKYGVSIGTNDRYAHDGTHGNDVAGIGQAADGSQHTNASSSRLNISSPLSLANDRFALFGHDNGALTLNNMNAPSGYRRLNRVWRYDETGGDVGTVNITFDVTGIVLPSGESFRVFVDADGDFSNATEYTGTLSGNTFTVSVPVNIADGDYITLGRTFSGPSAPVSLTYTPNTLTLVYGTSGSSVTPDVDDGGSPITIYSVSSSPSTSGISINSLGVISVASTVNAGTYTLSVTAQNGVGTTTFNNVYTVTVQPFNVASIFYNSATVPLGASVSIAPNPAPPSGLGITYSLGSLPSGLLLNTSTGVISGTLATAGVYTVSVDINSSNPNTTGGPVTRTCQIAVLGATGPGGVGDDQTSPVWFRADAGTSTTADNTPISSWTSSSDNSVQASQNDPAKRPVLRTGSNGINNRPVVRFDGVNDFFNTTYTWPANQDQITMILVGRGTNFQSAIRMQSGGYIVYPWNSSFILSSDGDISGGIASGLVTGTAVNIGIARYRRNTTNGMQTFRNGTLQAQRTSANNPLPSNNLLLGSFGGGSEFTNADIAEIIIYRAALNEAQRIIVENYLSAKYGVTIPAASDFYNGTSPYIEQVHGIGTTDGTVKHTRAQSSGGLVLEERNNSLNGTNEFLLAGHNGINPLPVSTAADLPSGVEQRWSRIWYLDKTGTIDARIAFDFSDAGISIVPGTAANYRLLYRAGTSGPFSEVTIVGTPVIQNTDQIAFDVDDANLQDGYYTLGTTNSVDSPLPVELLSFTLTPKDNGVLIQWETGSELNNAGFILQRSLFRESSYAEIASYRTHEALRGLGTSPTGKAYTYFDSDRLQAGQTYFYKLLDVDLNGNITEHPVKEITLPNEYSLSQNYPNPFNPTTTIEFSLRQDGRTVLEIYSVLGQKVATLVDGDLKAGAYRVQFNASRLSTGLYFYRLRSGAFVSIKKMMLLK